MMCRHCHKIKAGRPRGLCWHCYYEPGVRDQYPRDSHFHPAVDTYEQSRPPREPTDAPPMSEAKIKVMIERALLGQSLFHPKDGSPADLR